MIGHQHRGRGKLEQEREGKAHRQGCVVGSGVVRVGRDLRWHAISRHNCGAAKKPPLSPLWLTALEGYWHVRRWAGVKGKKHSREDSTRTS